MGSPETNPDFSAMIRLPVILSVWVFALSLGAHGEATAPLAPPGEIVFYRNAGIPEGSSYKKLGPDQHLGSKVYALAPSSEWIALRKALFPDETSEFPVVFAEERRFPDGGHALVAAQLSLRLTGDGNAGPGPVIWCDLFVIDRNDPKAPKLLWRGSQHFGTLQSSVVHRGVADQKDEGVFSVKLVCEAKHERIFRFTTAPLWEVKVEQK